MGGFGCGFGNKGKGKSLYSLEGVLASIQGPPSAPAEPWAGPSGWSSWTGHNLTLEEPGAQDECCDLCMADWPTVGEALAPDYTHSIQFDALRDDDDDDDDNDEMPHPLVDSEDEDEGMTPD